MSNESLRESLEALRRAANEGAASEGARARLVALIDGLERQLSEPDDEEHRSTLVGGVRDAIEQLELEHPEATMILNRIMVTLGNAGI